jgi:predicted dienelactone hydrolase
MGKFWRGLKGFALSFGVLALVNYKTLPALSAETVVVRFGILSESFSLKELQYVSETGKFPDGFEIYTSRLSQEQRQLIIEALRAKIPINVFTISRLLNSQIGTTILKDLSSVVRREDDAGAQALRAAMVLGSRGSQGLSVLSFIESYPSQRLEINLPEAFKVAGSLNAAFWQTQRFMLAISPQLVTRKPQIKLPLDATQPGNAQVQVLDLNFDDQKRQRQIPVDVYWSKAATTQKPIIVFTHGMGSHRKELIYLAQHLASHGYVVVSVEHPGSNEANVNNAIEGKNRLMRPQEFLDRPKDISFVLDELTKLNNTPNNPLRGKLATNKVMVLGYSFGGTTALSLGGAELQLENLKERCKNNLSVVSLGEVIQCIAQELPSDSYQLRDDRVKSVIAISPPTSLIFGETGLSKLQVPSIIWTTSADKTTPALTEQVIGFDKIPSSKLLIAIIGGTHLSVKDPSATLDQVKLPSTPYSGDEVVGEKALDIRNYLKAVVLAYSAQLTPDAKKYSVFLTSDYAQYASTQAFPIRLVTSIPDKARAVVKEFVEMR